MRQMRQKMGQNVAQKNELYATLHPMVPMIYCVSFTAITDVISPEG